MIYKTIRCFLLWNYLVLIIFFTMIGCKSDNQDYNENQLNDKSRIEVLEIVSNVDTITFKIESEIIGRFAAGEIEQIEMMKINEKMEMFDEVSSFYEIEILPAYEKGVELNLIEMLHEYPLEDIIKNQNLTYEMKLINIKFHLLNQIVESM